MAEFFETMKEMRRMCREMGNSDDSYKCKNCPLDMERICTFEISDIMDNELKSIEEKVMMWAENHKKPISPTFGEWLCNIGLIHDCTESEDVVSRLFNNRLPDDIAQKLGIEPKEG